MEMSASSEKQHTHTQGEGGRDGGREETGGCIECKVKNVPCLLEEKRKD